MSHLLWFPSVPESPFITPNCTPSSSSLRPVQQKGRTVIQFVVSVSNILVVSLGPTFVILKQRSLDYTWWKGTEYTWWKGKLKRINFYFFTGPLKINNPLEVMSLDFKVRFEIPLSKRTGGRTQMKSDLQKFSVLLRTDWKTTVMEHEVEVSTFLCLFRLWLFRVTSTQYFRPLTVVTTF